MSIRETEGQTGVLLGGSFFKLAIIAYFVKLRFIIDGQEFMVGTRETKFVPLQPGLHKICVMAGGVKSLAETTATHLDFEIKHGEVIEFVGRIPFLVFMKVRLIRRNTTYSVPSAQSQVPMSSPPQPMFSPPRPITAIECPGCSTRMTVPKLGELQKVTCGNCGLAGEIKI